jgi:hypothetical protein
MFSLIFSHSDFPSGNCHSHSDIHRVSTTHDQVRFKKVVISSQKVIGMKLPIVKISYALVSNLE